MTLLHDVTFTRTLDRLLAETPSGSRLEAWTFDDAPTRNAAERAFAEKGVVARLRCAYKPLLHFFLEEADIANLTAVSVAYPVAPGCRANRFLLEAYPLAGLLDEVALEFKAGSLSAFTYDVVLTYADGRRVPQRVFAPNRTHSDRAGETDVSPTGWLRVTDGGTSRDERLETEYEQIFDAAMDAVSNHRWGDREPYFEELSIRVGLPAADRALPIGEEVLSLRETLHEELYFSLLEVFQIKSGKSLGDRTLRPGQIVPEIVAATVPRLTVETRRFDASDPDAPPQRPLETAAAALAPSQVAAELAAIPGEPFAATTRAGRPVLARYHAGSDAAVMISGGQHANETSGVVGALRAARILAARPSAHFTVAPLENPDGYALHRRLCRANPAHMHHAARYTALGDDLDYRVTPPFLETEIRHQALKLSGALLHVNLHGYPSHEWTRPLTGYVPRGFAMWMLPRGFFLIIRHRSDWAAQAELFIDAVTWRLGAVPGLAEFTAAQMKLYDTHVGEAGFEMVNGFPCLISTDDDLPTAIRLTTEYPDETVTGEAFVAAHAAQTETVLAAYDAFQAIVSPHEHAEPVI